MQVEDVSQAQLVIGMARQHVREAVLLDRNSFPRAFTLRELVRRGTELGPREPDESLQDWLVRVQGLRRLLDLVGDYGPDDIPDPLGGSSEAYRRMLIDVRALVNDLYSLIWA
jgi:protein-tyrosine-phosphatase